MSYQHKCANCGVNLPSTQNLPEDPKNYQTYADDAAPSH